MEKWLNKIHQGDCLELMKQLPDGCVQICVTSPPYWGLRDYGVDGQLGLEQTPEEYVSKMVAVFREVRRVLKGDGTLWLDIGDCYCANRGNTKEKPGYDNKSAKGGANLFISTFKKGGNGIKDKDLVGIPWLLAFALRADGWYLRQDIIWHKPNPMPESVRDRCTKAHEYIFLMSKSQRYFYDAEAIKEQSNYPDDNRKARSNKNLKRMPTNQIAGCRPGSQTYPLRNRRSVWTVTTHPYSESHFATFPPKLIEPCILAGSRINDVVLDPFMGAGTTAVVSAQLGRKYIGMELSPEYCEMARERIKRETAQMSMFHG